LNQEISTIMIISIILLLSPFFSKIFRVPTTIIEIVFGSIATYIGLISNNHQFDLIAEIGFLYLMFLAGLEVDFKKLLKTPNDIIKKGVYYLLILYSLSSISALFFQEGKILIVIVPLISIGLLATLTKEYGKNQPWIQYGVVIGVLGEIVSIVLLTIVSASMHFGFSYDFYKTLVVLILFFVLFIIMFKFLRMLFWWYPEIKTYLMPQKDSQEQDIRISFGLFFITIALTLYLHLEVAFGAFLAGVIIASFFEHKKELPHKLETFGFGFLIPIFFIHVGSSFDINALFMDSIIQKSILFTSIMVSFRIVSALVFYKDLGSRDSILFALSHSMPLTLIIAVSTLAHQYNSIDDLHYYSFILASIIEVIFAMSLIKLILKFSQSIHSVNK